MAFSSPLATLFAALVALAGARAQGVAPAAPPPTNGTLPNCTSYFLQGDAFFKTSVIQLPDGASWEHVVDGSNRLLRMRFNRLVDVQSVSLQLRINREVRMVTYDADGKLKPRFFYLESRKEAPVVTEFSEKLAVSSLLFQSFDAQLTFDEMKFVSVTACEHTCLPPPCFGDCKLVPDGNCQICQCPEANPSSGCSGLPEQDFMILHEMAQKRRMECFYTVGYRRHINEALNIDDCIAFSYPKCDFYKKVIVPATKLDCLKFCY